MTIGFFHVDRETQHSLECRDCAKIMVRSAKAFMPLVKVVQFTDEKSGVIDGVDKVRRKRSEPMALLRMRHHASVEGDWLFVDTDVVFQRTVRKVFDEATWDIGITTRNWDHLKAADGFSERMPFNTGVVFSRTHRFWQEVYRRLRLLPKSEREWMGDQQVIGEIVAENISMRWFHIHYLKGSVFNYPPTIPQKNTAKEQLALAAIVHYKGPSRKRMMLAKHSKKVAAA